MGSGVVVPGGRAGRGAFDGERWPCQCVEIDAASLGGIVLGVYGGLRGVKFLRDTLNAPLEYESRQDRADTIRRLRADGWTNSEIRNQARGEH